MSATAMNDDGYIAPPASLPRVLVGIATTGRAPILAEALAELRAQRWPGVRIAVSYAQPADIEGVDLDGIEVRRSAMMGCTCQRNAILDEARDEEFVLFLDDDFIIAPDYLAACARTFAADASIVGLHGRLLGDGAKGPGLSVEEARRLIADAPPALAQVEACFNTYGCNMAFRLSTVRENRLQFDERLALYGWYEDIDFSRRLGRFGRIVRTGDARGVHLGVKRGRTSGKRFGYSQIINPVYLALKGSYPWDHALRSAGRHTLINLYRSPRPEAYIDRRGRVLGNILGIFDLLRGRVTPERVVAL